MKDGGSPAAQPAPDRRAAEQQAAEEEAARRRREDDDRQDDARREAAEQEAAEQQAAEAEAARRRREEVATQEAASRQEALGLSRASSLLGSSNKAADVLEADTAFSKLTYGRPSAVGNPFFDEQAQLDREQYLTECMIIAGRGLLDAFTELLNTPSVWDRLAESEHEFTKAPAPAAQSSTPPPFRTRMVLAELLTQHIPEVLLILGYRPPPPAEEWIDLVQNSVQNMLAAAEDGEVFAGNSAIAQFELRCFTWRLRGCIEAAEESREKDRQDGGSRLAVFRSSLRTFLLAGRNRAVPAALAAGASGALAGLVGGPAGMGIGALSSASASLIGTVTEAGATALLAKKGPQGDTPVMATARVVRADVEALGECVEFMGSATSTQVESIHFMIRRGVFQTLQDAASYSVPVREKLWKLSGALLSLLDAETFLPDKASQIVDAVRKLFAEAG